MQLIAAIHALSDEQTHWVVIHVTGTDFDQLLRLVDFLGNVNKYQRKIYMAIFELRVYTSRLRGSSATMNKGW